MRHATRPLSLTTTLLAAPLMLLLACSDDGWGQPGDGGGGNGTGGGGGGGGGGPYYPNVEDYPPGLDDSGDGGGGVGSIDCVTHHLRAFAYPIYANESGDEMVSPGPGEIHPLICIGPEDNSTHDHFAEITICGPLTNALNGLPDGAEIRDLMEEAAVAKCEEQMFAEFDYHWPELEQEYEHWLGGEDFDVFVLSRVACVPINAGDDPWMDSAAGWCENYDNESLADLVPLQNEQGDDWEFCHEEPVIECNVPYAHGVTGGRSACEEYQEQVVDIVLETDGDHHKAAIDSTLVDSLLSLEVAHCESNPFDGQYFVAVDDASIFAAVGFRDGDRPTSVQALSDGEPIGPKYPLGEEATQVLEAFAALFGVEGEHPSELRVTYDRRGDVITLDLTVAG